MRGPMRKRMVGLAFVLSGCASTWTVVRTDEAFRATGLERAGFELGCPANQLKTTVLAKDECNRRSDGIYVCNGSQVGVVGCGKKTTYRFPALGRGDTWVRDSEVLPAETP